MAPSNNSFYRIWQLSLLSFIIAAITGFLYRYGMLWPVPDWLSLANIRHAHSHLMFFNWVSPPVMAWIASRYVTPADAKAIRSFSRCLGVMMFLGFLSYPLFLVYGYHPVPVGSTNLPLAAILSGCVMITWYRFAWLVRRHRKRTEPDISTLFFDAALVALMISSLGAWGVSIVSFIRVDNPLIASAMTHFFLSLFTEGWAVPGVLGILWHQHEKPGIPFNTGWLWKPILLGSMLIFPFGLTKSLVTPLMLYTAKTGAVLIVISLSLNLYLLINEGRLTGFIPKTILTLIGVKILFQVAALLPLEIWPGEHGLRVLYLHTLLLGIVSLTLVESFTPVKRKVSKTLFAVSVLLVLLSLVLISGYCPPSMTPPRPWLWVTVIAFLPTLPAVWIWSKSKYLPDHPE